MKILFLLLLLGVRAHASEKEECQIALIEESAGNSIVVSADGKKTEVNEGLTLSLGDLLVTGNDAWVDLRLCDGTGLRVGEKAKFYFEGVGDKGDSLFSWAFSLVRGSLFATVTGDGKGDRVKFRVRTPSAALGVRGTEFVIDADDAPEKETRLHTVEGEVLMGRAGDFDKLGELRGAALSENFEPVSKEKMSRIRKGEGRAQPAADFKLGDFRKARKNFFERKLQKKDRQQLRGQFQAAHQKSQKIQKQRGLFERPRAKIEARMNKRRPKGAVNKIRRRKNL